jgi:hypothetical protein
VEDDDDGPAAAAGGTNESGRQVEKVMKDNCVGAEFVGEVIKDAVNFGLEMTKKPGIEVGLRKSDAAERGIVADLIAAGMAGTPSGLLVEITGQNGDLSAALLKGEDLLTGNGFGTAEGDGLIPVGTDQYASGHVQP